jgi:hypothetical protein
MSPTIITDTQEFFKLTQNKTIVWSTIASLLDSKLYSINIIKQLNSWGSNIENIEQYGLSSYETLIHFKTKSEANWGPAIHHGLCLTPELLSRNDLHWFILDDKLINYLSNYKLINEIQIANINIDLIKNLIQNNKIKLNKEGKLELK